VPWLLKHVCNCEFCFPVVFDVVPFGFIFVALRLVGFVNRLDWFLCVLVRNCLAINMKLSHGRMVVQSKTLVLSSFQFL
jgi:hypothetical protein